MTDVIDISDNEKANTMLLALCSQIDGADKLDADFWIAVRAYHRRKKPSKAKSSMIAARMNRVVERGLLNLALHPTALCVLSNVQGIIHKKQKNSPEITKTLLNNISDLIEHIEP